jgi:hypothetical protein
MKRAARMASLHRPVLAQPPCRCKRCAKPARLPPGRRWFGLALFVGNQNDLCGLLAERDQGLISRRGVPLVGVGEAGEADYHDVLVREPPLQWRASFSTKYKLCPERKQRGRHSAAVLKPFIGIFHVDVADHICIAHSKLSLNVEKDGFDQVIFPELPARRFPKCRYSFRASASAIVRFCTFFFNWSRSSLSSASSSVKR